MSMIVNGVEIPKNCAECVAGAYEYNDNDERCFVCGFVKSQHPWECEHAEIDGIDTTKMRAYFCPISEVATPHWISVTERLPEENYLDDGYVEPSPPVLVYMSYHCYKVSRYWGHRKSKGTSDYEIPDWMDLENYDGDYILAWMPLPAPPKETHE